VEFGAVGAAIAAAFWLAAMREAMRLTPKVRAWGIGVHASLFAVAMVSHGAWQAWWLALIVLAMALIRGADAAQRRREAAAREGFGAGTILYLATEDWFFASHFLGMARTAREIGLSPVLAARASDAADRIASEGIRLIDVPIERRSRSLLTLWRSIGAYRRIIRATQPEIIHCIALKPILLGGFAAFTLGHRAVVLAPTGLGASFVEGQTPGALTRAILRRALRFLARRPGWRLLFENDDDPRLLGLPPMLPRTIVPGAGVPADAFLPRPEPPAPPLRAAMVCRMVAIKGVEDAVVAVRRARAAGIDVTLDLWGDPDASNPTSIPEATLRAWSGEPGIHWHGRTGDVRSVWREAHVALQLSRGGEGLPRTIVEAKASARPVITTDVPGCRQAIRHSVDGILVPPRDPDAAATALRTLFRDPDLRRRMGVAARADFESRLAEPHILAAVSALYRSMLTPPRRDP
jgi:glycosyltransferase involved in cell wall biosynthesis